MINIAPDGSVQAYNKRASKLIGVVLEEGAHLSALMERISPPSWRGWGARLTTGSVIR